MGNKTDTPPLLQIVYKAQGRCAAPIEALPWRRNLFYLKASVARKWHKQKKSPTLKHLRDVRVLDIEFIKKVHSNTGLYIQIIYQNGYNVPSTLVLYVNIS